jgi:predicted transcriptional regulator YdeE
MDIQTHHFTENLTIYCKKAESFPMGVKAAFKFMHSLVDFDPRRMQLGLSRLLPDGGMDYWAGSQELHEGEFQKHNLETITLPAGEYRYVVVKQYMEQISAIGEAFQYLMDNLDHDTEPMGVEWYVSMEEVWCMLKIAD